MRRTLTLAVTVILLASVAGPAMAAENSGSYESSSPGERDPSCTADGEKQNAGFVLDGRAIPLIEDNPAEGTQVPVILEFTDADGNTILRVCGGEHWDSQDPNSKDSSSDTRADESDGSIYVNPLGDCSSWNSDTARADGSQGEGCSGGTDRPTQDELIHIRVTGDVPGTDDDATAATTYHNLEIWGVGRSSTSVHANHDDHNGWVAIYLEDHSDQVFKDIAGNPIEENDGNYLTIPFDPVFGGEAEEGDCNSSTYQDPNQKCPRDNTAATVEFGYNWLPWDQAPSADTGGPSALP